jgi:hypothetical protein
MCQQMLIALDSGTPPQRDAISAFLRAKGWDVWHWIDDLWLVHDAPPEIGPRELWRDLITSDPTLVPIKGLILRPGSGLLYWGGNATGSWPWLLEKWGRADFPRPQPDPG